MPNEKIQRIAAAAEELQAALNAAGRRLTVDVRRTDWEDADSHRSYFVIKVEVIDSVYP
jgi:hypothetical protein